MQDMQAKPAKIKHAEGIERLLTNYSQQELLLPRSLSEIVNQIPLFLIIETDDRVIGCVSLEIFTKELGEVRSLAVDPKFKNQQLGKILLSSVEHFARDLGLQKMMALTYVEGFFHKYSYKTVEMTNLPEKVFRVCVKCPKFHNCDEIPVLKTL